MTVCSDRKTLSYRTVAHCPFAAALVADLEAQPPHGQLAQSVEWVRRGEQDAVIGSNHAEGQGP